MICWLWFLFFAIIIAIIVLFFSIKKEKHKKNEDYNIMIIKKDKNEDDEEDEENNFVFIDSITNKIRNDLIPRPNKWTKRRYLESNRRKLPIGLQNNF